MMGVPFGFAGKTGFAGGAVLYWKSIGRKISHGNRSSDCQNMSRKSKNGTKGKLENHHPVAFMIIRNLCQIVVTYISL